VVAATVVVVHLVGAAVLAARLASLGLDPLPVVSALPREGLVAIGLSAVVLPTLAGTALAALPFLPTLREQPLLLPSQTEIGESEKAPWRNRSTSAFALLGVIAGALAGFLVGLSAGVAVFGGIVGAFVSFGLGQVFALKLSKGERVPRVTAVGFTLLAGVSGAFVFFLAYELPGNRLARVQVCHPEQRQGRLNETVGYYIGETEQAIYIADVESKDRRVRVLPQGRAYEVRLGDSPISCPPPTDPPANGGE
jgi:hypothetical protein